MSASDKPLVAIVDDEKALRDPVADYLNLHEFEAVAVDGGVALDALMRERVVDLVVLDINMPGEDGISIARRLRAAGTIGIIMLTTRAEVIDRVVGLEVGADDYVAKPFEMRELLARLRSVIRRSRPPAAAETPKEDDGLLDALWVPARDGMLRVDVSRIDWIEAAKDYVVLHVGEREHLLRTTMSALEQSLDPDRLVRVHRSAFVAPRAVVGIETVRRRAHVTLVSGRTVDVAPHYLDDLVARLKVSGAT